MWDNTSRADPYSKRMCWRINWSTFDWYCRFLYSDLSKFSISCHGSVHVSAVFIVTHFFSYIWVKLLLKDFVKTCRGWYQSGAFDCNIVDGKTRLLCVVHVSMTRLQFQSLKYDLFMCKFVRCNLLCRFLSWNISDPHLCPSLDIVKNGVCCSWTNLCLLVLSKMCEPSQKSSAKNINFSIKLSQKSIRMKWWRKMNNQVVDEEMIVK